MFLIVGLGNPGDKYNGTRHNLGFEVLDNYSRKFDGVSWSNEEKFKAEVLKINDVILVEELSLLSPGFKEVGVEDL